MNESKANPDGNKSTSSELPRFNDTFEQEAEQRKGLGGQFGEKYNLLVSVKISVKIGQTASVSTHLVIPADELPRLEDDLRHILGKDALGLKDISSVSQLSFEIDSKGEVVPESLLIAHKSPIKATESQQEAKKRPWWKFW